MDGAKLASKIVDALWDAAERDYPLIGKMVSAVKQQEVRKKLYDVVFREISIADVKP